MLYSACNDWSSARQSTSSSEHGRKEGGCWMRRHGQHPHLERRRRRRLVRLVADTVADVDVPEAAVAGDGERPRPRDARDAAHLGRWGRRKSSEAAGAGGDGRQGWKGARKRRHTARCPARLVLRARHGGVRDARPLGRLERRQQRRRLRLAGLLRVLAQRAGAVQEAARAGSQTRVWRRWRLPRVGGLRAWTQVSQRPCSLICGFLRTHLRERGSDVLFG